MGEHREHDVERVAYHVDDRSGGQDQPDQRQMHFVEDHLVGEIRLAVSGYAVHLLGVVQIRVAQRVQAA